MKPSAELSTRMLGRGRGEKGGEKQGGRKEVKGSQGKVRRV